MADQRADDVVIEISIRTEDGQEAKSVDLSKDVFRTNDETGGVDFASDAAAQDVLDRVRSAILVVAQHPQLELGSAPDASAS